nr:uncharacterized protein LOC127331534 [Lolium perenne]
MEKDAHGPLLGRLAVLKLAISVFHLSKRCSIPACSCIVKIFRFLVFPTCLFPHLPLITASTVLTLLTIEGEFILFGEIGEALVGKQKALPYATMTSSMIGG